MDCGRLREKRLPPQKNRSAYQKSIQRESETPQKTFYSRQNSKNIYYINKFIENHLKINKS